MKKKQQRTKSLCKTEPDHGVNDIGNMVNILVTCTFFVASWESQHWWRPTEKLWEHGNMISLSATQYPVGASTFPTAESVYDEQKSFNLCACFFNPKKSSTLHIFSLYPSKHAEEWHEQQLIHFHRFAHGWSCPRSHHVQSWLPICFHRLAPEWQGCLLINCSRNQESGLNPQFIWTNGGKNEATTLVSHRNLASRLPAHTLTST